MGGSTGGWHALNQAINAPGRIASISMLDPTTVTAPFSRTATAFGLVSAIVNRDWLWRRFLRWSVGEDAVDRPDVRLVLAGIRAYRPRVPFQVCPTEDAIRSVEVPVLAIFGTHSVVHDAIRAATRLRHLLPEAEVHTLPNAGHGQFLRPHNIDQITELVLAFIDRTPDRR